MEQPASKLEWNLESAELAYTVIARYVEHTQLSGLVIALLAGVVGEENLKVLVASQQWQSFQESKRGLAEARVDIDQLTHLIERMREAE